MSNQSEAKERQRYEPKPVKRECRTCQHFRFDMDYPTWAKQPGYESYRKPDYLGEVNLRCGIGGFAVKKTACCKEWVVGTAP